MWHSDVYVALLTVIAWTREATQGEIITTGESLTVPLSPSILLFLSLHFYDLFTLSVYLFTPSISSLFLSLYSHHLSVSIYLSLYISSLSLPPFSLSLSLSLFLFRLSVSSLCLPQFSISSLFLPCLGASKCFQKSEYWDITTSDLGVRNDLSHSLRLISLNAIHFNFLMKNPYSQIQPRGLIRDLLHFPNPWSVCNKFLFHFILSYLILFCFILHFELLFICLPYIGHSFTNSNPWFFYHMFLGQFYSSATIGITIL